MDTSRLNQETIDLLQRLISLPSFSGLEEPVILATEEKMKQLDYDKVWRDLYGNVIATRTSPSAGATILFDTHVDVIGEGQASGWRHLPFGAEMADGKIWGRGATDAKSSLAAMVVGLGSLPRNDFSGTLVVVGSVGEEMVEGAALAKVIDEIQPQGVVIGEPTDCRLGIGHKGRARVRFKVTGRSAHSSTPQQGDNAIYKAPALINRIHEMPLPNDPWVGQGIMEATEIVSSPFPGGSILPNTCTITYDRRLILGETPTSVLNSYKLALADLPDWEAEIINATLTTYTGYTFTIPDFHPAWRMEPDSAWVSLGKHGLARAGIRPDTYTTPFCTNGSYSGGVAGIPTLVFGPSSILFAHSEDEYISVDELQKGLRGFMGLASVLGSFT